MLLLLFFLTLKRRAILKSLLLEMSRRVVFAFIVFSIQFLLFFYQATPKKSEYIFQACGEKCNLAWRNICMSQRRATTDLM